MGEKKMTGYPSIDKPWLKYYSEEAIHAPLPECTIYEELYKNNFSHPDDIALVYYGRKISYKELFQNIEYVRRALSKNGVRENDNVILLSLSTPESVYTVYALCRIGAAVNLINPLFSDQQIIERINETDAEIMIILDQFCDKIDPILAQTCVKKVVVVPYGKSMPPVAKVLAWKKIKKNVNYSSAVQPWKYFLEEGNSAQPIPDALFEKERPLVMVYSSGTTGASKGIVLTNSGIEATILHYKNTFQYHRGDRFLHTGILWFSTGIVVMLIMPLNLGITVVLEPIFHEVTFTNDLKRYKPNMGFGTTSMWLYAMESSKLKRLDMSFLTYPITGGEMILPETEDRLNRFLCGHGCKVPLIKGWGMCELGSTISSDSVCANKRGAAGIPLVNVTVAAFDSESNKEQKYRQRGELRVQSPSRMKEYFKNPTATSQYFWNDDNGVTWGCTGDIGYIDPDGFVHVLGRTNDTFYTQQNQRVYCFDVENVILENPNIEQCEVVGLPTGKGYDIPVAHLVVKGSCTIESKQLIEQIHTSCTEKLKPDWIPKGYKIRPSFPVKPNGKRDIDALKSERTDYIYPDGKQATLTRES